MSRNTLEPEPRTSGLARHLAGTAQSLRKSALCAALAAVAIVLLAPAAQAQEEMSLASPMTRFLPPPPPGWESPMPPTVTEDLNGLEPSVAQGYGPRDPNVRGLFAVTINHPSRQDLTSAWSALGPPGPSPMAPWIVTSLVKVNGLDAYLHYNREARSGILQMKVGRVMVAVQGGERTAQEIVVFAGSMDLSGLVKY